MGEDGGHPNNLSNRASLSYMKKLLYILSFLSRKLRKNRRGCHAHPNCFSAVSVALAGRRFGQRPRILDIIGALVIPDTATAMAIMTTAGSCRWPLSAGSSGWQLCRRWPPNPCRLHPRNESAGPPIIIPTNMVDFSIPATSTDPVIEPQPCLHRQVSAR